RYAEGNPTATLIFYTEKDWNRIQDVATEGNKQFNELYEEELIIRTKEKGKQFGTKVPLSDQEKLNIYKSIYSTLLLEVRACIELVEKCQENNIDVSSYLGKRETFQFSTIDEIKPKLEKYIGSNGLMSPIVRSVELNIDHEMLNDIEIIDTPGLNDPVVSRSQETKKYLGKCDVVILLSLTSHFLGAEDVEFIRKILPNEGIRYAVVTASQIDNAVLDLRNLTFFDAYKKSGLSAKSQFDKLKLSFPKESQFSAISAMLAACAYKKQKNLPLDSEEHHTLEQLKNFKGFDDSPEKLYEYSGLQKFTKDIIPNTRKKRAEIKEKRQTELLEANQASVEMAINRLLKSAQSFYHDIQTQDVQRLEQQAKDTRVAFSSVRVDISNAFSSTAIKINQNIATLENTVIRQIDEHTDLTITSVKHTAREYWETGSLWWKKSGYETVISYVDTVAVSDVLEQMRRYSTAAQKSIQDFYSNIININSLKQTIKQILVNLFRNQEDFHEDRILAPLEAALGKISIPPFRFNNDEYNKKIEELYSEDKVEAKEIYKLRRDFELIMQDMGKDITKLLISKGLEIENQLNLLAENFLKDIENSVQTDIQNIMNSLQDKENSLKISKNTITVLQECLDQVASLRK
ncbi:MAG: dynamin family protein, partial [Rickettsiales bacterium]|nr:dynamin family protein [Rickettsiales bacterium]